MRKARLLSMLALLLMAATGAVAQTPSPEYVDLGLSVKWATCNVGTTSPQGYGDFFSWGETAAKTSYSWSTYTFTTDGGQTFTKYNSTDSKTVLDAEDDAATAQWGYPWRMPTAAEYDELLRNCTWEWTTIEGVNGYKVTSNVTGYTDKFIFLPAAGFSQDERVNDERGSWGIYWVASAVTDRDYPAAPVLYITNEQHQAMKQKRYSGFSVRAVYAPTFTVALADGTDDADKWTIAPNNGQKVKEKAEITVTYSGSKKVKSFKVKDAANNDITVTAVTGLTQKWSFTMPASAVELQVEYFPEFTAALASGTADANEWIIGPNNGQNVREGDNITVSYSGSKKVKSVTAKDAAENAITVTPVTGQANQWSFTMPANTVELQVEYATEFTVALADGTDDADKWTIAPNNGQNVREGNNITVSYSGSKKVKSVKAMDAANNAIDVTAVTEQTNQWTFTVPSNDVKLQVIYAAEFTATFRADNANTIQSGAATVTVAEGTTTTDVTTNIGTDGKLSPINAGQAVAMEAATGYAFRSVTVVDKTFVNTITLNKTATSIVADEVEMLSISSVKPDDTTDKTVTWYSDNESVAIVDADGKVTAVAVGTANITATANDGSEVTATCVVTVTQAVATAHTLAESKVGDVVATNGSAYTLDASHRQPSDVTAAGMVAYKNGSIGLAIALSDEANKITWDNACGPSGAAAHTPTVTGQTWKLPSQDEWKQMFKANGGNENSYVGLNTALAAAGGDSSKLQDTSGVNDYWSSSATDAENAGWLFLDEGSVEWSAGLKTSVSVVRACFAF